MRALLLLVSLTGCSQILGIEDLGGPGVAQDGSTGDSPDGSLPEAISVRGTVQLFQGLAGTGPADGAEVEFILRAGNQSIANTITALNGTYALDLVTGGQPLDGFVHVKRSGNFDTFVNTAHPLTADADLSFIIFDSQSIQNVAQLGGAQQSNGAGVVIASILDGADAPLAGAILMIDQAAAAIRYADSNSMPSQGLSSTTSNGVVWVFNVQLPAITLTAAPGMVGTVPYPGRVVPISPSSVTYVPLGPTSSD